MFFSRKQKKEFVETVEQKGREELNNIKKQVGALINEQINPVITQASDRAEHAAQDVKKVANNQIDQVSQKIKSKPLLAIVISSVVGYLLGRSNR
ncbi:hypothetical protein COMNV_00088 [Commensalibacter sp. Nvir]|uniref:hypothetical protein n=1 Tax=Commensalibacter sp. Nvir TaxID=3069817 RepID=UPI002D73C8A2|nr:hypothetical protein COMNV_00088 [Commensalibacter sp. Nvir]